MSNSDIIVIYIFKLVSSQRNRKELAKHFFETLQKILLSYHRAFAEPVRNPYIIYNFVFFPIF